MYCSFERDGGKRRLFWWLQVVISLSLMSWNERIRPMFYFPARKDLCFMFLFSHWIQQYVRLWEKIWCQQINRCKIVILLCFSFSYRFENFPGRLFFDLFKTSLVHSLIPFEIRLSVACLIFHFISGKIFIYDCGGHRETFRWIHGLLNYRFWYIGTTFFLIFKRFFFLAENRFLH